MDCRVRARPISELRPGSANARIHSDKQVAQIARSISAFGFVSPVLITPDGSILAGHGRVRAAERLGMTDVPTLEVDHLSPSQMRAYMIADNRLAELAGWDEEILRIEFQHLLDAEIDFEITDVGFDIAEIDILLGSSEAQKDGDDEFLPAPDPRNVSNAGDLWLIGPHRLLCGNALDQSSYEALLNGELASVVFSDPPYNVKVSQVSGRGVRKHREFLMASGEMSEAEFTRFLSTAFRNMAAASDDGALQYICIDWRHLSEALRAGRIAYSQLLNLCVWTKRAGGMGSFYRSQHELILVFRNGEGAHQNNVMLGQWGRNRSNVWSYPGLNSFQHGRADALAMHPTVKPVALVADAILDCTGRGDIVLDPFAGSGTSTIAAHRTGRRCFAMELDPVYVDVAVRRVRQLTGIEPTCARTGDTFSKREADAELAVQSNRLEHGG